MRSQSTQTTDGTCSVPLPVVEQGEVERATQRVNRIAGGLIVGVLVVLPVALVVAFAVWVLVAVLTCDC